MFDRVLLILIIILLSINIIQNVPSLQAGKDDALEVVIVGIDHKGYYRWDAIKTK